jgi:two-component system OmpR family sensor kinase/two-component system sensor histidine kinase BaeS
MNRLWVRLTFAFVVVTLIGVAAVALLADAAASEQFQQYLTHQEMMNQGGLLDELAAYYQQKGSWDNVAVVLDVAGPGMGMGAGRGRGAMRGASFTLADSSSVIVYGADSGARLTPAQRASALAVAVDGATVGYLITSAPGRSILNQAQQAFLDQLRNNILIAALAASGLAVILGLLISRALAMPLSALAAGARTFAARNWAYRVTPRGTQEMTEVALAFNEMAESLQRAEALRRDMVADIAHELRTPVAVIQGNLRAMLDGVYPLERAEIATVYDETLLLNRLIGDLRELALAEAGQLTFNLRDVDVAAEMRAVAERFAALADAQGVALEVLAPADLSAARADTDRLGQVLQILLTNALRYTPSGGRVILAATSAHIDTNKSRAMLELSIRDTGAGIKAEDLPHVFDRFYRGDKSRARSSGGTGLGLAIAKSLVEGMGGRIGVESVPGQGSRFWFALPRATGDLPNGVTTPQAV